MLMQDQSPSPHKPNPAEGNPRADFNCHPAVVVWELTRASSLEGRFFHQRQRNAFELNSQEAFRFIEQIIDAHPSLLVLIGGDLTERADLNEIIANAASKGLRVALNPFVTPNFLKTDLHALKQLGMVRLCLNLHGATSEIHDTFLGIQGSWKWTIEAIHSARAAGIETQIDTTFTRRNRAGYRELVSLLPVLKPAEWNVSQWVPNAAVANSELLNGEETEELLNQLAVLKDSAPYGVETTDAPQLRRVALQHHDQSILNDLPSTNINDGKGQVFVNHLGEISPGRHLPIHVGNVRGEKLIEAYRNNRVFRGLRDTALLKGKCGCCEFHLVCGGSRARAYAATGDYLAQDPLCVYQPKRALHNQAESWRMYCDD